MGRSQQTESSVKTITISRQSDGQRLDNFLIKELKGVPRSRIYRLIRRGEVRLNKKRCKPDLKLSIGDRVRIPPVRVSSNIAKAGIISPGFAKILSDSILFETEELLVLNKPAGFAVQGGTGIRVNIIDAMREMKSEWRELELAHRLDRDTSGCLLFAKKIHILRELQLQFKLKTVKKVYFAIVHGCWPDNLTLVNAPLLKNRLSSGERIVKVAKDGKPSETKFKVIERFKSATMIEARPITGRTHQIRVHCQYAGHPILGDLKYSVDDTNNDLASVKNLCLHAAEIEFIDSSSKKPVRVTAPIDKNLHQIIKNLNHLIQ